MKKLNSVKILAISLLILFEAFPLFISTYFFSVNDLVKSSLLYILGGIIIAIFSFFLILQMLNKLNKDFVLFHTGSLDLGVLLLLIAVSISTVFSLNPSVSFRGAYERQVGLITYLYLASIYFIAGTILNDSARRKTALLMIEFASVIISAYAILQFLHFDFLNLQPQGIKRPGSTLGYSVFLGGFLALFIPFSVLNTSEKKNKFLRYASPLIIFTGIIVSGTRSAYIALAIQFVIIVFFYKNILAKNKKAVIAGIAAVIISAFLFLIVFNNGVLLQRIISGINIYNPRIVLWKDAINIFFNYPLTGSGIGMFPAAFEQFYSNALRFSDANVTYDHAHNNFLQTLLTLGLAGLAAYIFLIYKSFRSASSFMKMKETGEGERKIALAIIIMLAGYCAYGLTNFDDISILFLFFILLSVLRSLVKSKTEIHFNGFRILSVVVLIIIFVLSLVNIPLTIEKLRADRYFKLAFILFNNGMYKEALNYNNKAIETNPACSMYRYFEANEVYDYYFDNSKMNENSKKELLKQVENEIEKVKKEKYYVGYCNGLLSLVYFEQGKNSEGDKLMYEVLAKDSINVNYRIKLARYLIREKRLEEAKRNLNVIMLIRPNEKITSLLNAMYYRELNDRDNAVVYARKVLAAEPNNKIAFEIIKEYESKK